LRGRADSPGSLAQGMLHRDGPGTEESSPSPLPPGGPPLVRGREVRATKGRPEEARTDAGAVLRPHSTDEGGKPQGSGNGRPRNPLEGRGKQAYESAERSNLPSPSSPVTFFEGPECIPVNSRQEFSSKTANAYSVVYLDFGGQGNGHGEFIVHSCALSTTPQP
jgi:hypothetical protein